MKKYSNKFLLLPFYSVIPLLSMLFVNIIAYYGTRLITESMSHYDFSLPLDEIIPFNKYFIVFYILAYVQWVAGYILIADESKKVCYQVISGEVIAKLCCLVLFIAVPTSMQRASLTGNDVFSKMTGLIYMTDLPNNLFPSIHCLESWICFRGALRLKKVGKWYSILSFMFTVFVCLSTVFVKQHVVVDIIGGIAVAELGLWLASKLRAERIFEKLNGTLKGRLQWKTN